MIFSPSRKEEMIEKILEEKRRGRRYKIFGKCMTIDDLEIEKIEKSSTIILTDRISSFKVDVDNFFVECYCGASIRDVFTEVLKYGLFFPIIPFFDGSIGGAFKKWKIQKNILLPIYAFITASESIISDYVKYGKNSLRINSGYDINLLQIHYDIISLKVRILPPPKIDIVEGWKENGDIFIEKDGEKFTLFFNRGRKIELKELQNFFFPDKKIEIEMDFQNKIKIRGRESKNFIFYLREGKGK